ncbi:MAG: hypothetical protein HYR73_05785 [Candidatus Eisenbacteria bacterium]|nr:hypothetical protein [Candidatus Eisenbacteria bacterium]
MAEIGRSLSQFMMWLLIINVIAVLPLWIIFRKAGFPGWLSLTQAIPVVNFLVLLYVALMPWPAVRDLKRVAKDAAKSAG